MRKLFCFVCTLILFLTFSVGVSAQDWTKYSGNPLAIFTNQNELRFQPSVIYTDGLFSLWHSYYNGSAFGIARTQSVNGVDWDSSTPIAFTNRDSSIHSIHDPTVIWDISKYVMWFVATYNGGSNYRFYRAESLDGNLWTLNPTNPVLVPQESWEARAISSPYVYKHDNKYYLFYSGWGPVNWNIGLASSSDGISWARCDNNPRIMTADGPSVVKVDNQFKMYFHGDIEPAVLETISNDALGCEMKWVGRDRIITSTEWYENGLIISPSVVFASGKYYLYYSGLGTDGLWRINLATKDLTVPRTEKYVILPGFLGSWNKNAIVYNQPSVPSEWVANPIAKEYTGLKNTLNNLNLEENKDYYFFYYDWRKKISDIVVDLNNFIDGKVKAENINVNLVGHSLGGLVARIYSQEHPEDEIKKVITVASPHKGVVQAYKPLAGGELDKSNPQEWLMQKLILQLNRQGLQTDKQVLQTKLPILADMLPTEPFLFRNGTPVALVSMQYKNTYLPSYNQNLESILPILSVLNGNKGQSPSG